jgi:hypothetical protein
MKLLIMKPFVYQCSATGLFVQGWFSGDVPTDSENTAYVSTSCPVCSRIYLINPLTGKVMRETARCVNADAQEPVGIAPAPLDGIDHHGIAPASAQTMAH